MTDYSALIQPDRGQDAHTIHLIDPQGYAAWHAKLPERVRRALTTQDFKPVGYTYALIPPEVPEGRFSVVTVVANVDSLSSWCLAKLAEVLPEGTYRLSDGRAPGPAVFGWLTAQYRFDRYKTRKPDAPPEKGPRVLLTQAVAAIPGFVAEAEATALVRDMVNTPAEDMGPAAMEEAVATLGKAHAASVTVTRGDALAQDYPLVHAVGRAADRTHAPRLIELTWGRDSDPRIAVIGKGVAFDTGGLDIKPAAGMALMKKDMGGAAHALGLAQLIMRAGLPVRLHLIIPAVENAIAGNAFRPGDIIRSRKGTTVEIENTDAEGRLILADAFARAGEETPSLMIDFATLTGAARVALGPDLPALFSNDDALADAVTARGRERDDPVWRMPLWGPYDDMLKSDIADVANSAASPMAGAVTAALFLKRFVPADTPWVHLDTFAWRPVAKPGRSKGGEALGLRAVWAMLQHRFGTGADTA